MPVYNGGQYLAGAVKSILAQTFSDFEFVIVDDGSNDGSSAVLAHLASQDSRIRLISQANTGLLGALNNGLRACRGEFIARMDADDIALPNRFWLQVNYLREHPDAVAVGSRVLMIDPDGVPIAEHWKLATHDDIDRDNMAGNCAMCHPSAMFRRSAIESIGGYRFAYAEDHDLWLRLGEIGRLANLGEILLKYRMHLANLSHSPTFRNVVILEEILADARRRRGLPPRSQSPGAAQTSAIDQTEARARWARLAIHDGYYASACVLAAKALRARPASSQSWGTLALALSGPVGRRILKARVGVK